MPRVPRGRSRRRPGRLPKELRSVNLNAAGIDIGAERHWVAVPEGRDPEGRDVREFGTFTSDLEVIASWLRTCGIETVAMESTGVYWIPLYELLSEGGFDVKLVDPRQLKRVPGRKTDLLDCQWLQQLHTFGLLAGAFRPDDAICVLRGYLRQRGMLVTYASQHIQHMQKALEQMNVKLPEVVSDIAGKTGLAIIRAITNGERNPMVLAMLRDRRCQHDQATIARALHGTWREEHLFALQQALELFDVYHKKIADCDKAIEACLHEFDEHDKVANRQALRLLAGSRARQQDLGRQAPQQPDEDLREPRRRGLPPGRQRAPPQPVRAWRLLPSLEGPARNAQGDHSHRPETGVPCLQHAQARHRLRRPRPRVLRASLPTARGREPIAPRTSTRLSACQNDRGVARFGLASNT